MISIRIMLVEDEDETAELIQETLSMELEDVGISATWTVIGNAISARRAVREGGSIDVAIVDLFLGKPMEKDGATVVKDIRARSEHAYILVTTGHPDWAPSFRDEFTDLANHTVDKYELGGTGSMELVKSGKGRKRTPNSYWQARVWWRDI